MEFKKFIGITAISILPLAAVTGILAMNDTSDTFSTVASTKQNREWNNIVSLLADAMDNEVDQTKSIDFADYSFSFKIHNAVADKTNKTITLNQGGYIMNVTALNGLSSVSVTKAANSSDDDCAILCGTTSEGNVDLPHGYRHNKFGTVSGESIMGSTNFCVISKNADPVVVETISVKYACTNGETINTASDTFNDLFVYGTGTEKDPYLIENDYDYEVMSTAINNGTLNTSGKYISLKSDVNVTKPLFDWSHKDNAYFDGEGNTIYINYTDYTDGARFGIFGDIENGSVENLVVKGSIDVRYGEYVGTFFGRTDPATKVNNCSSYVKIKGGKYTGGIAGYNSCEITNCTYGGTLEAYDATNSKAGGIAGFTNSAIKNCKVVSGASVGSKVYAGGIVGTFSGEIVECTVDGATISGHYSSTSVNTYVGGIGGKSDTTSGTVNNCSVNATIKGYTYTGGIVGYACGNITGSYNFIENPEGTYNKSTITCSTKCCGGIAAYASGITISNCHSRATISGFNYNGGIAGQVSKTNITSCKVYDSITCGDAYNGGIVGYATNSDAYDKTNPYVIKDCKCYARITSASFYTAGIVGYMANVKVDTCEFQEYIVPAEGKSLTYTGAIVGRASTGGEIVGCTAYECSMTEYVGISEGKEIGESSPYLGYLIGYKGNSVKVSNNTVNDQAW